MNSPHGHEHAAHPLPPASFWSRYVFSTDHKVIGIQFLFASLFFVLLGGLLALGVRYQLAWPQQDVPYARLLPLKMTSRAPEANLALWNPGAVVEYQANVQFSIPPVTLAPVRGLAVQILPPEENPRVIDAPAGIRAVLDGFPRGVAVTLPPQTLLQTDAGVVALRDPTPANIDRSVVMGDYDYARSLARTVRGTVVTLAPTEGRPERRVTLAGVRVHRPARNGSASPHDDVPGPILLPIDRERTVVSLRVQPQTVHLDGVEIHVPGGTFALAGRDLNALLNTSTTAWTQGATTDYVGRITLHGQQRQVKVSGVIEQVRPASPGAPADSAMLTIKVAPQSIYLDRVALPIVPVRGIDPALEPLPDPVPAHALLHPLALPASEVNLWKDTLTTDAYLQLFTMHASIMIFFVIIPMLVGAFGNFVVPLMVGARDMAFPRLNALSFWLSVPAGVLMLLSFWTPGGAAGGGWTMYPTLSHHQFSSNLGTTLWIVSVGLVGFSSVVGALNYITTILNMRAPGMTLFRMPLTAWSILVTAILALFATPVLTAAMIMLLMDRTLGTLFFTPVVTQVIDGAQVTRPAGGQPILWQHLFWFYSHPAVYIMILPAMGVVSDILATFARKPIFGYRPMIFAICGIAFLGFIVWGHHMFQSGMNPVLGTTFMASTIMIAVPSAIKTFNWLGTLWGGNIRFTPAMLNALGFVSMFVIGGLSGIFMASSPVDIHIHDTYFIVAHIHYVLFGGSLFGIFAGIYYWFPKMFGRQLNQRWGVVHFVMTFIAFNGTFFLMHVLGIGGAPRRYASHMEYPTLAHLQPLNVAMTLFAMMLGMAQIPFLYNLAASLPPRLGRAITALFAVMLTLPAFVGLTYWNVFRDMPRLPFMSVLHQLVGQSDSGFSPAQAWTGYLLLLAALALATLSMLRDFRTGARLATLAAALPALALVLCIMRLGMTDQLADPLRAGLLRVLHDLFISLGLGIGYAAIVVAIILILWNLGGAARLPAVLQRLLYIIVLPAFMMPMAIKPEVYHWLGAPALHEHRWMIVGLLALPGLIYLVAFRPRDAFGAIAPANPWHANSLEWQTSSPPPVHNFDEIPTVYRGPYEYSSPAVREDYLPQPAVLPAGVVEPTGH